MNNVARLILLTIFLLQPIKGMSQFDHIAKLDTTINTNATFQGGTLEKFKKYVLKKYKIPDKYVKQKIKTRILIHFNVDSNGTVNEVKIEKGSGYDDLDIEALKVFNSSPKWKPAIHKGIPVKQQFIFPLIIDTN